MPRGFPLVVWPSWPSGPARRPGAAIRRRLRPCVTRIVIATPGRLSSTFLNMGDLVKVGFITNDGTRFQIVSRAEFLRHCAIEFSKEHFSNDEEIQAFHESHKAVVLKLQSWGYDQLKAALLNAGTSADPQQAYDIILRCIDECTVAAENKLDSEWLSLFPETKSEQTEKLKEHVLGIVTTKFSKCRTKESNFWAFVKILQERKLDKK